MKKGRNRESYDLYSGIPYVQKNYFFENAISTRNSRSQHEHNFFSDSKTNFLLPPFEDCFAEE